MEFGPRLNPDLYYQMSDGVIGTDNYNGPPAVSMPKEKHGIKQKPESKSKSKPKSKPEPRPTPSEKVVITSKT